MNIREIAPQFQVLIFSRNLDLGSTVKVQISQAGYESFFIEHEDSFWDRLGQIVPHIVVLDLSSLTQPLNDYVEKINAVSPEICLIFLTEEENFQIFVNYADYNVRDVIHVKLPYLKERVLWAVNRTCESLFLLFKNEQLYNELQERKADVDKAELLLESTAKVEIPILKSVSEIINDYRIAESKEDIIRMLFQNMANVPLLFFKFLPSMNSFVLSQASMLNHQAHEGLGSALNPDETKDLIKQIVLNIVPPSFNQVIINMFTFQRPSLIPLFDRDNLEGVFVFDQESATELIHQMQDYVSATSVYYSLYCMEKRLSQLEIEDPVTELFNKKYFNEKLRDEFERAKRLKLPLSLIKIAIDDFEEIERTMGEPTRDLILKSVATVMNKTGRANDVTCRTGINEFSIILPHCSKKGASLRAERLRRLIESHTQMDSGLKVTVSLGASEYPSLCRDQSSLEESSVKSMRFIASKGGNRICLYKAPDNFVPDYGVDENELN
ncbi:MAG: GGDEF domain-containing protein [Bdellovibrionaceae bacterium]|nr:GGDEF domain-containing protein [Pseudobdellovibrionaceae bacterium]